MRPSGSRDAIRPLKMRVVDLSTGIAGGYCAKVLADAGADVIKLEPPGGDPLRSRSASGSPVDPITGSPLFQYLHSGQRSAVADLSTEQGRALALRAAGRADLVLESFQPGELEALGLGLDALHVRNPATSLVSVSAFGRGGPWSTRAATDFTMQAWCGSLASRGIPGSPPVGVGGNAGEFVAGSAAASAAALAVLAARDSGRGQHVDVSALETMILSFTPYQPIFAQFEDRLYGRSIEIPSIEPAADGWVGICTITHQQWADFSSLIGHPEWGDDPTLSHAAVRMPRHKEIRAAIAEWTTARTVAEIVELASLLRIPVTPVGNGHTVLEMEQYVERGVFQHHPGGFQQPRRPYLLGDFASPEPLPSPCLDEHAAEVAAEFANPAVAAHGAPAAPNPRRPLEGKRVVAFVAFWAGPFVASYLAAMGADVIKVESIQRPDGMRFAGGVKIGDPLMFEWSAVTHGANVGLRDVTLDLSRPEGAELARRLVEGADIVLDNFSPRVLDGFGLSEQDLRSAQPDVVIVRMPAFGLDGPWRDRGGFAMTVEQNSGLAWLTGFPDDGPLVPRGVCDVLGGLHAIVALLGALEHRRETGEGLLVEVPLAEAALNIAAEQTIEWTANGVLLERHGNRSFSAAPQGVYPCADEDSYVVLAVETDAHWQALQDALGRPGWAADDKLATAPGRHAAHDEIDAELTDWLRDRPMLDAVEHLAAYGVPAAPTIDARRLNWLPQIQARGWFQKMDHPVTGPIDYVGLPMTFSGMARPLYSRAAPTLGQDNEEVLRGLGLSEADIAKLAEERIIGTRPAWL
ncbi:MAG TPA: CoA transferase [Frankiaceae bacterium]|nr:CoA transferase [Frankiaceae bacterium]